MNIASVTALSIKEQAKVANRLKFTLNNESLNLEQLIGKMNRNSLIIAALAVTSPELSITLPFGFIKIEPNNKISDFYDLAWSEGDTGEPFYLSVANEGQEGRKQHTLVEMFQRDDLVAEYNDDYAEAYCDAIIATKGFERLMTELEEMKDNQDGIAIDDKTGDRLLYTDQYFVSNVSGKKGVMTAGTVLPHEFAENLTFYATEEEREHDYPERKVHVQQPIQKYSKAAFMNELESSLAAFARKPIFNNHNCQ